MPEIPVLTAAPPGRGVLNACAHCGEPLPAHPPRWEEHAFCCTGCRTAFQLIHELGLEDFYALNDRPGAPVRQQNDYAWMDEPALRERLIQFQNGSRAIVRFRLPAIHCSSCVWLLERLPQYQEGVLQARVHFGRRELELHFDPEVLPLSTLAVQLQRIGYAPEVNRADLDSAGERRGGRSREERLRDPLLKRLGVAGFCAGNIMLLSFPDYLEWDPVTAGVPLFGLITWLKVLLSLPVLFYSGSIYWKSAWLALRRRVPSVDIPLALGMLALGVRSYYDIAAGSGPGYLDSLAGLVFLLLVGRWFQDRVYGYLSFQRDYRSFFPASVLKLEGETRRPVLPDDLQPGDRIFVRPGEIVPADGELEDPARMDYHFLTGESAPEQLSAGAVVYGGGRVLESPVRVRVSKTLGASYLASLWDQDALRHQADEAPKPNAKPSPGTNRERLQRTTRITDRFSRLFTPFIIALALVATAFWWSAGPARALEILTAVLIVACPCGLALAAPFSLGHALRFMDRAGLHLRDAGALERLARLDTLVFDKTGTLTAPGQGELRWEGRPLSTPERRAVASLASCSAHPLSVRIASVWGEGPALPLPEAAGVLEETGKGVSGEVEGRAIRIGSAAFAGARAGKNWSYPEAEGGLVWQQANPEAEGGLVWQQANPEAEGGPVSQQTDSPANSPEPRGVFISLDGQPAGRFVLQPALRPGAGQALKGLALKPSARGSAYSLELLSGDRDSEQDTLRALFPPNARLSFGVSPFEKLERVEGLQRQGRYVGMFGDGLNDAGSLAAADVGLAVADDLSGYFPASDGVLNARSLGRLPELLRYARAMRRAVWAAIGLSMAYNAVGLSFAVAGLLTPLVAAILMPLSSLSVASLGLGLATLRAWQSGLLRSVDPAGPNPAASPAATSAAASPASTQPAATSAGPNPASTLAAAIAQPGRNSH